MDIHYPSCTYVAVKLFQLWGQNHLNNTLSAKLSVLDGGGGVMLL